MTEIHIPNLGVLRDEVRNYIKEHQGSNGFIATHNPDLDYIWTMVWTGFENEFAEYEVAAVRVKNDTIQILYDFPFCDYTVEELSQVDDEEWKSIEWDDYIVYLNTLFSIAENITQFFD